MAQVPYTPYPTATPNARGTQGFHPNAPEAAFGASVGQALQHLGNVAEGAGNELFSRAIALQNLNNEAEARDADSKYMIAAGNLHAKFSSLQGADAAKAFPQYQDDLNKARTDLRQGLSNDMARKMYDGSSLSTMGRSVFNGAGHAATQQKLYDINTIKAQSDLDIKTIEDNPKDNKLFQDKLERIKSNARELSARQGFGNGSPQEQDLILNETSKAWANRITGLSRTDPFTAAQVLDANRKELTEPDFLKVDNAVRGSARAVGSANIAQRIYDADKGTDTAPAKSLGDMESQAREEAKKQFPDDPILEKHAVDTLKGIWNQDKYARRQEEIENEQIVSGAIGKGVRDERELRLDPKTAAAIDALPATKRNAIPGAINRFNEAKNKVTNQDSYQRLYGLSNNDVEAFLNTDVTHEALSQADMRKLQARQELLKKNQNQDPRVSRAMGWMRGAMGSQMEALGVFSRTQSNKDDYDHLTGAVQSALDVWQEGHGKPPSYKEFTDQIAPEVLKQRTEKGWLWNSQKPFFTQDIPDTFSEKLKADVVAKGGVEPTPEQIYRAYIRTQFIKLYGGKKGE